MKHILLIFCALCMAAALIACTKAPDAAADNSPNGTDESVASAEQNEQTEQDGQPEQSGQPDAGESKQDDQPAQSGQSDEQDETEDEQTTADELSVAEQKASTKRHFITRDMVIEETLRNVTVTDAEYIAGWLSSNEALAAYYPAGCHYKPSGRVVIDGDMYYFIYVSTESEDEQEEPSKVFNSQMLLAMDYSEAYECWWLSDTLLIYDIDELLGNV